MQVGNIGLEDSGGEGGCVCPRDVPARDAHRVLVRGCRFVAGGGRAVGDGKGADVASCFARFFVSNIVYKTSV